MIWGAPTYGNPNISLEHQLPATSAAGNAKSKSTAGLLQAVFLVEEKPCLCVCVYIVVYKVYSILYIYCVYI